MKPLKELYELLWEQIKDENYLPYGLCYEIDKLDLTGKEYISISDDLMEQTNHNYEYKWDLTAQGTEQRKEFVQSRIKELTDVNDTNVPNIKQ